MYCVLLLYDFFVGDSRTNYIHSVREQLITFNRAGLGLF